MHTLTITDRGQVTLRKAFLQHLGIKPGDKIEWRMLPNGQCLVQAATPSGTINDFVGLLAGKSKKVATLTEINAAIAEGWAGKK